MTLLLMFVVPTLFVAAVTQLTNSVTFAMFNFAKNVVKTKLFIYIIHVLALIPAGGGRICVLVILIPRMRLVCVTCNVNQSKWTMS